MAKFSARDRAREILLGLTEFPHLKAVWVESCRKVRKQDKYDLILRTEESLHRGDVEIIEKVLGGDAGPLTSGYEFGCGCDICGDGGSSYIELEMDGCTFSG